MRTRVVAAILMAALAFAGVAEAAMKAGPGVIGRFHRLGPGPGAVLAGAGLDYNFMTGQYFQQGAAPGVTVVRASSKSCDDNAGNWTTAANNVLCVTNKGALIEEARTNSLLWSTDFNNAVWSLFNGATKGATVAGPLAGSSGITINFGSSAFSQIFQTVTIPAGAAMSVFARSNTLTSFKLRFATDGDSPVFNLTPQWQRFVFVAATGSNVNVAIQNPGAVAGSIDIAMPQLEAGGFATSYIPTTTVAATRAADVVMVTTPPTFGAAYTLFAQGTPNAPVAYTVVQNILQVNAGSDVQRLVQRRQPAGGALLTTLVGGTGAAFAPAASWAQSTSGKLISAVAAGDQASVFNGGTPGTNSAALLPTTPTAVQLGVDGTAGGQWNGYLERIALWPTSRLPNATLQSLTQ